MAKDLRNKTKRLGRRYSLRISNASPSRWNGGRGCNEFPPLSHRLAGGGAPPTTHLKDKDPPTAPTAKPPNEDIRAGANGRVKIETDDFSKQKWIFEYSTHVRKITHNSTYFNFFLSIKSFFFLRVSLFTNN